MVEIVPARLLKEGGNSVFRKMGVRGARKEWLDQGGPAKEGLDRRSFPAAPCSQIQERR
jgi:hypothetical protein